MWICILIVLDVPENHWGTQGRESDAPSLWAMGIEAVTKRIASKTYSGYGRCWKFCLLPGKCSGLAPVRIFAGQMRETELKCWALIEKKLGENSARLGIFFGVVVWTSCTWDWGFKFYVCVGASCSVRTISMLLSSNWNAKLRQLLTPIQCWYCLCVPWLCVVMGQLDVE